MQREEANLVHLQTWATNERSRTLQTFNSDLVCQQTPKICLSIHTHPQLLYIVLALREGPSGPLSVDISILCLAVQFFYLCDRFQFKA